jgi:predicted nucleic acid-binding protein
VKDKRVIIDTSVWIAYFKENNRLLAEKVDRVLTDWEVFVPKEVIAELTQGAKSEKEISVIAEFFDAFQIIDQTKETWLETGRLSYAMRRKGITIPLMDCYITVLAMENQCRIFSLDEHFALINKFNKLKLIAQI